MSYQEYKQRRRIRYILLANGATEKRINKTLEKTFRKLEVKNGKTTLSAN